MKSLPATPWIRRAGAVVAAFALVGAVLAQGLLLDVTVSSAIAATLNPGIRLPRNSLHAVGPGAEAVVARVADSAEWTDWEVYTATGFVRNLQPLFAHNLVTSFALVGLWESERSETVVGEEVHSRFVFDDGIDRALLYVIQAPSEVVWMIAKGR